MLNHTKIRSETADPINNPFISRLATPVLQLTEFAFLPNFVCMKCPYCGVDNDRVLDTRAQNDGGLIRRRRECLACKARFSTVESVMVEYPMIIKKDGRREPFSREKIQRGIQAACQKRPIPLAEIENIVDRIATWLLSRGEKETSAHLIGHKAMLELKKLDGVAYIRFASVYRTFEDVQEFVETLEDEGENTDASEKKSQGISTTDLISN